MHTFTYMYNHCISLGINDFIYLFLNNKLIKITLIKL